MGDPLYMSPVRLRPKWDWDPREEDAEYYNNHWLQPQLPLRTRCYICKKDSPAVFAPWGDVVAFGDPTMRKCKGRKTRDITTEVVMAFAEVGWKVQYRRAYCPHCKGLARV